MDGSDSIPGNIELSSVLEREITREIQLRHITRLGLGIGLLIITMTFMPFMQEGLDTVESTHEQVAALDSHWNTVSVAPGDHASDFGKAEDGDVITVQFLVTTQYLIDRDKSIDFYIMDQENYQRYKNGQSFDAIAREENLESGTFSREVAKAGTYYIVFDNSDDILFEPEEEVKYRFVIYRTLESEEEDLMITLVLILPSLVLMATGGYGWWSMRRDQEIGTRSGRRP